MRLLPRPGRTPNAATVLRSKRRRRRDAQTLRGIIADREAEHGTLTPEEQTAADHELRDGA